MSKRILAMLLALVMVLSVAPTFAMAEETETSTLTKCYTSADGYWGECSGSANESFVFKFYNDDTYMGSTSLNDVENIIDGDVYVTWNMKLDAKSNTDQYWTMEWTVAPTVSMQPNRVEHWVDGVKAAEAAVEPNEPDNLNPVVAAVTDAEGKILSYVNGKDSNTLEAALANGGNIALLKDVTLSEVIQFGNNVTINGGNHKVTSSANRVFRVAAGNLTVTMNKLNIVSTACQTNDNDIRGISLDGEVTGVNLALNDCSVAFDPVAGDDWAYAVNVSGTNSTGNTVTIKGGSYNGANVINVWGNGHTINIDGATLSSLYVLNEQYHGSCVRLEGTGVELDVENTTFKGTGAVAISEKTSGSNTITQNNNTDQTGVAQVNGVNYPRLDDAIAEGGEVKLLADVTLTEQVVITKDVTITAENAAKITVSISNGSTGAAFGGLHVTNGTLSLGENVTVTNKNSLAFGVSTVTATGSDAKVVIDGATVMSECENNAIEAANGSCVTINSGNVYGTAIAAAYASGGATIEVKGGKVGQADYNVYGLIASKTAANSGGNINISGGEVWHVLAHEAEDSKVAISGGTVNGTVKADNGASMTISGGTFTADPSAYVAQGYIATKTGDNYVVAVKVVTNESGVSVIAPDVTVKEDVQIEASAVQSAVNNTATNESLEKAAAVSEEDKSAAEAKATEAFGNTVTEVTTEVRPHLEVAVDSFNSETSTLTVKIEAVYDLVAVVGNKEVVVAEKELDTTGKEITITLPLPNNFNFAAEYFYVKHTKDDGTTYTYKATVDKTAKTATFVNPNGFSTFEVYATSEQIAEPIAVKHNLNLASEIDFSFFIDVNDLDNTGLSATITHKHADGDKSVPVEWKTTLANGVTYWRLRYEGVAAKEMTDELVLTITDASGNEVLTDTYSIKDYAMLCINDPLSQEEANLMKALLDYGAAAQEYFSYKTNNLANADLNG